jgi:hypothetical protein
MMRSADFVLAVVPPALAIVLQVFPIPSDRYIDAKARELQVRAGLPLPAADMILGNTKGALALAAFAPTVMSFILSPIALIYDLDDFGEWLSLLLCLATLLVIVIASSLTRFTPFELSTTRLRLFLMPRILMPFTWTGVINAVIYVTNLILIILAIAKLRGVLPHLTFFHGSAATP